MKEERKRFLAAINPTSGKKILTFASLEKIKAITYIT